MTVVKMTLLVAGVLYCLGLARARAADQPTHGFLDLVHKDADGKEAKYVLFVPQGYQGEKAYPLILFLHGLGESGSDGKKQVKVGLGPVIAAQEKTFPCFAIFPQSQQRTWKAEADDAQRALAILAATQKAYKIDPERIYLTGLSMGGFGTWSLAVKYPEKWAAIVPICGGGNPKQAAKIKDIPCWCFHGDADPAVPVSHSRQMIKALQEAGGQPKYTEYPGVGHISWEKAYATPELFEWLFAQRLK